MLLDIVELIDTQNHEPVLETETPESMDPLLVLRWRVSLVTIDLSWSFFFIIIIINFDLN